MAALDAALAGLGIVRMRSYQVAGLVAERKLRVVLAPFERAPLPVHLVRLPGVQTRAAAAFIEFAAERIRERLGTPLGRAGAGKTPRSGGGAVRRRGV